MLLGLSLPPLFHLFIFIQRPLLSENRNMERITACCSVENTVTQSNLLWMEDRHRKKPGAAPIKEVYLFIHRLMLISSNWAVMQNRRAFNFIQQSNTRWNLAQLWKVSWNSTDISDIWNFQISEPGQDGLSGNVPWSGEGGPRTFIWPDGR